MMKYFFQKQEGSLEQVRRGDWRPDPNGPTYPAQCFDDPAFRAEHGLLTERFDGARPDARFYTSVEQREVIDTEVVVTYAARPHGVATLKAVKLEEAAQKRYEIEVGGVDVSGVTIPTDRESQTKWVAVRTIAKEDADYVVQWKTPGGWVTLDAQQIIAIADAVQSHVQSAFDWEAAHSDAINALTDAQSVIDYEVV